MFRLEKTGYFESGQKWKEEKYERQSSQNEYPPGLNIVQEQRLKRLLIKAFNCSSSVSEKEIVLVLGATDSGKSTTICYLVGCEMEENEEEKIVVKDDKGHDHPVIGIRANSQTLFPQVFETEAKIGLNKAKINLNDCPGFEDNRFMPEKICTFVSTQAAINAAASIKSIIIVIEYGSFFVQHAEGLRKLLDTLSHLFYQPGNLKESVMFIITKTSHINPKVVKKRIFDQQIPYLKTSILKKLRQMKEESKGLQGTDEPTAKEKEELAHLPGILDVLCLIERSNTIFIDPLDDGNCRREIFKMLLNLKKVDKSQFRFNFYDEHHLKFKQFIFKIARNGYRVCQNILEANYEMKRCMQEIKHIELSHASHTNTLDKLKYDLKQLELNQRRNQGSVDRAAESELTQSIMTCNDEIKRLTLEKTALELGQTDEDQQQIGLKDALKYLEKNVLERYWSDSLDRNTHVGRVLKKINSQLTVLTERKNNLCKALSKTQLQQNTIEQTANSMRNAISELKHLRSSEESYMNKIKEKYEDNLKKLQKNQTDLEEELQSYQLVINSQATIQFDAEIVDDFTLKYFQVHDLFPHIFTKMSLHSASYSTGGSTSSTSSDSLPSSASRYSSTGTGAPVSTSSSSSRLTTTKNSFTRG